MEYLQNLLESSTVPILTAFLLGLLTAISPCPLATNIAAVGYISKDMANRSRIFSNGLLYTLGRAAAYTMLGAVLITVLREGASVFTIQKAIGKWGEVLIGPALILIGLFMLFGHRFNLPKFGFSGRGEQMGRRGGWGAFLFRCPSFAGILPDERHFLFRNADSDVGCRNGRLSLTGRLCCRYGASRGDRRMDIGIQRCRDRGFLQPDADDSKMAYTDCRNAFYCRRYLLRYNLFLLKR
jgi:cytochrome c biogenesis protein